MSDTHTSQPLSANAAPTQLVILAAGQGTRMHSDLPKVLHRLAGRPLLARVLDTVGRLGPDRICVIHGHGGEQVRNQLASYAVDWVEQAERLAQPVRRVAATKAL